MRTLILTTITIAAMGIMLPTASNTAVAAEINSAIISEVVQSEIISAAEEKGFDDYEISILNAAPIVLQNVNEYNIDTEKTGNRLERGRATVKITVTDNAGQVLATRFVTATLKIYETVAIAAGQIDRGEKLGGGAVTFERVDITRERDIITDMESLEGCEAKRRIREGDVVSSRHIRAIPLVHRGEDVTIVATVGNVQAVSRGKAREDGARDDVITVYNTMTNSSIECRVLEQGVVQAGM